MSLLAYLLFASIAVLLPGITVQRLLRLPIEPALVIPAGTALCAGAYWLALAAGSPWLVPAGLVMLAGAALARGGPWRLAAGPSLRGAVPPVLALLVLLAVAQFRFNRLGPEGDFELDPLVTSDSAFHVGLARELVIGHPPQLPGVSGFPIGYHLGTDLVRAAALRWARVDPWDSLTRFDVTLWGVALVLAVRALLYRLAAPALAVSLAPWTLWLTDFSFAFAGNPQAHWWADLLRGNLLLSLAYANPVVPALGLALGTLVCLARLDQADEASQLALALLQAAAVPFFKVFLGAQLLLGLGVAFVLARGRRRWALLAVALPCALVTALLVLGQGGETVAVSLAPLDLVAVTRETLGLLPVHGARLAGWAVLWLLASLGLRVVGLPTAVAALRGGPAASALAAMALSGWPLGLLFRVSAPEVLERQRFVNDAAYLVEQSGPLLWLFATIALASLATTPARRSAILSAAAVLALPSTIQYAAKKASLAPDRLPAPMVRAVKALEAVSQPGDVVLQRPGGRYPPAPVVLAGRRVPYERFTPYLTQFASRQALEARHEQVYRFFRTSDRAEAVGIARSLGARFLALYGPDRVRFETAGLLQPIHEEPEARLYRLVPEP